MQKGSLDLAARFSVDAGGNLTLSDGVGTISELSLALPGNRSPLWRVPTLTATGVDVDVRARKVTFGELKSRGPALRVVRERDGSLEFARVLKPGQAKDVTTSGAEWTFAATKALTEHGAIDFEDRVPTPAVKLAIRDVDFIASDLSNARGAKSQFKLSGHIGERGRIAFEGPVATRPLSLSGTLEASGLALVALKPYFEHEVNVVVTARRICGERTGRAGRSRRRCGARLVARRDEGHRLRLVRQADVVRSCTLEIAGGRGHGHRERTVPRRHRSHRPRGLLRARHRLSGRHDQYRQAGNAGGEPGTHA